MSISLINNTSGSQNHCYAKAATFQSVNPELLKTVKPVINNPYQRDTSSIFTPELNRAISDRCRAIFNINMKEKFLKGSTSIAELHKRVQGISKLDAYISTDPVLSKTGIKYDDLVSDMKYSFNEGLPVDFDFNARRKALENLSKFGAEERNRKIFDKIGKDALEHIIFINEDLTRGFDEYSVENMRRFLKYKSLAPLRRKCKDNFYPLLLKKDESSKTVRKNIETLAEVLKDPEYDFLKKNKSFKVNILFYKGDTKKALNILKDYNSSLHKGDILHFFACPETGELRVQVRKEFKGGLKLGQIISYDKNLKVISKENITRGISSTGKKTRNILLTDLKYDLESQIREVYDPKHKTWVMTNQTKKYKDASGKVIKAELWKLSDVEGIYNIKSIDAEGKIKTVSSAIKGRDGVTIEKNLTSPLGDTTTVRQFRAKNGAKETMSYVINDKNGKILAQRENLLKKLSSTEALSVINGEKFNIKYLQDKITILNERTKELKTINIKEIATSGTDGLLKVLKRLSADELIAVGGNIKQLSTVLDKESFYMIGADKIACSANRFIFDHELGHAIDSLSEDFQKIVNSSTDSILKAETKIASDKKLQKIFNAEKKMFLKSFNRKFAMRADYFISDNISRKPLEGLREAIAEIYALKNNQIAPKWIMQRSHLLQENFTRTIAYLIKHKF